MKTSYSEELDQDFKELSIYFDDIYHQDVNNIRDAGNLWIAFTDKFNAFKKKVLSHPSTPIEDIKDSLEDNLLEIDMECAALEDVLHGEESKRISIIRKKIASLNISLIKEGEEAIEFAEWINKEGYREYDGYDRWIAPQNNNNVYETKNLYKLFKDDKK